MTRFEYEAARPDGGVIRGLLDASNERAALDELTRRRLFTMRIRKHAVAHRRRIPPRHLATVFRGLATVSRAGVPLDRALSLSAKTTRLPELVAAVRDRVRKGDSLGTALAGQPGIPGVVVGLVRAGEAAGLDFALDEAAKHLEREAELRGKLRAALTYPLVLLATGAGTIGVLVMAVLPRYVALLGDVGDALPTSTRLLLGLSGFLGAQWPLLTVTAIGAFLLAYRGLRTTSGHELLLDVPIIGGIRRGMATARAARTLGAMLQSGAPVLTALHGAISAAGDKAIARRLEVATERVRRGESLAAALAAEAALDAPALELLAVGEESGRVGMVLAHAADLAETDATRTLGAAVNVLEPTLIVALGGAIGFVALALLQAIYSVRIA